MNAQIPNQKKNPYQEVKRAWNEAFAMPILAMRQWRLLALGELIVLISLVFYLNTIVGTQRVIPYPVPVDGFGRVVAHDSSIEGNKVNDLDDAVIRAHLYTFIENSRSVLHDVKAMQRNLDRAYAVIDQTVESFLNQYFKENNSLELAREITREVTPLTFLKESNESFLIEWREIDRDLTGAVILRTHWKALITITKEPPETPKEIRENHLNPFGIFIEKISWDKIRN